MVDDKSLTFQWWCWKVAKVCEAVYRAPLAGCARALKISKWSLVKSPPKYLFSLLFGVWSHTLMDLICGK